MRVPRQQLVVDRRAREGDGVVRLLMPDTPPVEHDENDRCGSGVRPLRHRAIARSRSWRMAAIPAYRAGAASSSSILSSWLYFATRSVRLSEPVLICPAPVPTARSAMVVSSVSPDRCEMTLV